MGRSKESQRLSLDRPVTYQITVPGHLDESWTEWNGKINLRLEGGADSGPRTILTGVVDQAALHGLLRRLYALGVPLLSVICVECCAEDAR